MDELRKYGVSDTPVGKSDDKLDLKKHASSLARFIVNCATPMTIGIQGGWGTGKTSIMKMIDEDLDDHCIKIWINTWQYAQIYDKEKLPLWIIAGLARKLWDKLGNTRKASAGVKKLLGGAINTLGAKLSAGFDFVEYLEGNESKVDGSRIVEGIYENFETAIQRIADEDNAHRIVFFIDDIDRIPPPVAVAMLEAIKNFICGPKCVFVLAVDFDVICQGIGDRIGVDGREFFDKIIQVPYHLQPLRYHCEDYVISHLAQFDEGTPDAEKAAMEAWKGKRVLRIVDPTTQRNPRTIKRALNLYAVLSEFSRSVDSYDKSINRRALIFSLACLQVSTRHRTLHEALMQASVLTPPRPERILEKCCPDSGIERKYHPTADLEDVDDIFEDCFDGQLKSDSDEATREQERFSAELSKIANFMLEQIDVNEDRLISEGELRMFHHLLEISSSISLDTPVDEPAPRAKIVSFLELVAEGYLHPDERLVFDDPKKKNENSGKKKVYIHEGGKQHKVVLSVQGGRSRQDPKRLSKVTGEYVDPSRSYVPPDYTSYWKLERTQERLSDLIARYRNR